MMAVIFIASLLSLLLAVAWGLVPLVALSLVLAIFSVASLISPRESMAANLAFLVFAAAVVGVLSAVGLDLRAHLLAIASVYFVVLYVFRPKRRIPDVAAVALFLMVLAIVYQAAA
ncbi:MAG: hypothetical protein ACK4SY_09450 [Pyrobaculum sp.]